MDPAGWRSTCLSTLDRMSYALENGLWTDVSFLVGRNKEVVRGHRAILCMGSPEFEALLTKSSYETSILVRELEPEGFKPLLKYLYTDLIPEIPDEDYMEFFRAAKFFKVEELIEFCRKNILKKLALGNALNVFENGKLLDEKELEEAADEFIKKNAESILSQPKFTELSHKNLLHFISSDDFSAPEVPICLAVYKWGEAECERQNLEKCPENLRLVLKEILPQIRFPMMKSEVFAVEIAKLNLLTLEETVDAYKYIFARPHQRHQIPEGGRFIAKSRKYVNYDDDHKVDNVVWTWIGGINTGLRTDTTDIYTISCKGVGSPNYLIVAPYSQVGGNFDYGVVATKNVTTYEFGGVNYCSTLWGIRRGSEPNTYTLFSKYGNGYLTFLNEIFTRVLKPKGKKPFEAQNLTFEPSKNEPGYFMLSPGTKNPNFDKPMVLAFGNPFGTEFSRAYGDGYYRNHMADRFYASLIEKPAEEIDSILWSIQKIEM